MRASSVIKVSAPGRIVILGEHQDYFGLNVLSAAIDRRIYIEGRRREDRLLVLNLANLGSTLTLDPTQSLSYDGPRQYLKSCLKVVLERGARLPGGYDITITADLPIGKGVSSSSALCVAWCGFLLTAGRIDFTPHELAEAAFQAEVLEFNEPGGMQDHYASAFGGLVFLRCTRPVECTRIPVPDGLRWILGDSLVTKDTTGMLSRIKGAVLQAMNQFHPGEPASALLRLHDESSHQTIPEGLILSGVLGTRDLVEEGIRVIRESPSDLPEILGSLVTRQHELIRDRLGASTPVIDRAIDACLLAGALGGKINGSGGGGCFIILSPPNRESEIVRAIESAGGIAGTPKIDGGFMVHGD